MTQQQFKSRDTMHESGIYFVLMSVLLIAVLAIMAFTVDGGKLFRDRLYLQKAADAGVIAGLAERIRKGPRQSTQSWQEFSQSIEASASRIVRENLVSNGFQGELSQISVTPIFTEDPTSLAEQLSISISYPDDLYIMDLIPFGIFGGGGKFGRVTLNAVASGTLQPANISLVLDLSGSMKCPQANTDDLTGECPCLGAPGGCLLPSKAQLLEGAVGNFLDFFKNGYDRISLVPFNVVGQVSRSMREGNYQNEVWKATLDELVTPDAALGRVGPQGNTNPSHALLLAYRDARFADDGSNNSWWGKETINYVFFTDGAPTAAQLLIDPNSVNSDLPANDPYSLGDSSGNPVYDYVSYKVEWTPTPIPLPYPQWRYGPSALVYTQNLPYGYAGGYPPGWDRSATPPRSATVPTCSTQSADGDLRWQALTGCINSFSAHLPYESSRTYGSQVPISGTSFGGLANAGSRWAEQYYNATLAMGDFVRESQGIIYAVGLGVAPASDRTLPHPCESFGCNGNSGPDPYQNVHKDFARKDFFLARLANDPNHQQVEFSDPVNLPTNLRSWGQMASYPRGEYRPTERAEDLDELFEKIAKKILLKLIR